ncbi:MAG: GNAT family N-acetyltransferase [Chitinophagales bacterium]|nr:GNAT family N-acetyltransferase [Chitinophagales bacterium]MDW8272982.1 GNAT family N-acetyltransferase [Chitinophagales bacterium]
MKIYRYGVLLERLKREQIEMVRTWRNDPKISRHMFHRGIITPSMQAEWFESINNKENFFFLISYSRKYVGLINMSSIDWAEHTAYSGLFIYEDEYLGTDVPVRASLAMLDVFFLLGGIKKVFAKVRGKNRVAHRYNTQLGFVKKRKIELGQGFEYELERSDYFMMADKLRRLAALKDERTIFEFDCNDEEMELKKLLLANVPQISVEMLKLEVR